MESVEERSGTLEEICVAYHEKKTKYEDIVEDMKNLEKGLTVCKIFLSSIMQVIPLLMHLTD
jgi:hypothetical protein